MDATPATTKRIAREKTAIRRVSCSRPIAIALADGVITKDTSVFDYGCGHGADIEYLKRQGVTTHGWDPHFRPKVARASADVVNLGFVLNVIEHPHERVEALVSAFSLVGKALVVSVRVDKAPDTFVEHGDGYLTGRDTFQKLYTQSEFGDYLEQALGKRVHMASLGIAYIFADEAAEAEYIASTTFTRQLEYRTDLIEKFEKDAIAKKFVKLAHKLGRLPAPDEFLRYGDLLAAYGSDNRIARLTYKHIKPEVFEGSKLQRKDEILTYFATLRFERIKPPPARLLPPSIARDIKAIWPSYQEARADGEAFLFSIGNPDIVRKACETSPIGKKLPGDIYVHRSAEEDMPAVLRLILLGARKVVGRVEYDIVKISSDGKAVSFLRYPLFDEDPHPALSNSLRIYLPKTSYDIRDYSASMNPPILHRKDTLVTADYPKYKLFRAFTEAEEAAGLLAPPVIGHRKEWEEHVQFQGWRIEGHELHQLA